MKAAFEAQVLGVTYRLEIEPEPGTDWLEGHLFIDGQPSPNLHKVMSNVGPQGQGYRRMCEFVASNYLKLPGLGLKAEWVQVMP